MLKLRVLLPFIFVLTYHVNAQFTNQCYSFEKLKNDIHKDSSYYFKLQSLESEIKTYDSIHQFKKLKMKPYVIPVVVHVIHEGGPENISKQQIDYQIKTLNECYRKLNADTANIPSVWKSIAADFNIEFRLARKDPYGNCTDGIERIYSHATNMADDPQKKISWWDNTKYMNIWIVKTLFSNTAAFSSFPGGNPKFDGIMMRYDFFGDTLTSISDGNVIVHEVGHYLNLYHTWGDDAYNSCSGSDNVSDTPNQANPSYWGLSFPYTDLCSPNYPGIMFMNFMDYGDRFMFTNGQKIRSDATLNSKISGRINLWSDTNLTTTGVDTISGNMCKPKADFISTHKQKICIGDSVSFLDRTWNGSPLTWNWFFQGGTPSNSTLQNPVIKYNSSGIYDVNLIVSNSSGSDTLKKKAYVYVNSNIAQNNNSFYYESFDSISIPNSDWNVYNYNGDSTWANSKITYAGNGAITISNFKNQTYGADELISPLIDISKIALPKLKFQLAYALKTTTSYSLDSLEIYISSDCGQTWNLKYMKGGSNLATRPPISKDFIPTSQNEWREETINLDNIQNQQSIFIKFRFYHGYWLYSNNIYIDEINIMNTTSIENDNAEELLFIEILPNPVVNNFKIAFKLSASANVNLKLYDSMGKIIWQISEKQYSQGKQEISINNNLTPGIYVMQITIGNKMYNKKITVIK